MGASKGASLRHLWGKGAHEEAEGMEVEVAEYGVRMPVPKHFDHVGINTSTE